MQHYTYLIHVGKPTDSRIFYIGVRSCKCSPSNDSKYLSSCKAFLSWQKENGISSICKYIIGEFKTRSEAVEHEIYMHNLFNVAESDLFFNQAKQTSTGFDTGGAKLHSEERRKQLSEFFSKLPRTNEHRGKIAAAMKGNKYGEKAKGIKKKPLSDEHKLKLSASKTGVLKTEQHKEKISKALTGMKRTDESRMRMSKAKKGKTQSYSATRYENVACDKCGKVGMKANMTRYHFNNCSVVGPY